MNSTRNIALKDQAAKLQLRDENWGYVVFDGETGNKMYLPVRKTDVFLMDDGNWDFTARVGLGFDGLVIYRRLIDVGEGNVLVGLDEKMERVEDTYNMLDWYVARWFSKTPRKVRDRRAQYGLLPILAFRRRKEAETLGAIVKEVNDNLEAASQLFKAQIQEITSKSETLGAASQSSTSPSTLGGGGQEPNSNTGSSGGSLAPVNANEWIDVDMPTTPEKKFVTIFHINWCLNLGVSIDPFSPNLEVHLPLGFIRVGWQNCWRGAMRFGVSTTKFPLKKKD